MNQIPEKISEEKKMGAIKVLAIIGFVAAIIIVVWVAVQAVRFAPSAWSTLASMAETVYLVEKPHLTLSLNTNIVNSSESFTVAWSDMKRDGTYSFSYTCTDGVSAEIRNVSGNLVQVSCEEMITLSDGTKNTEVIFTAEKKRFTDIPFTIRFTPKSNPNEIQEKGDLVTVINPTISQTIAEVPEETEAEEEVTKAPEPEVAGVAAPVVTKPVPITTTTYSVSNPLGYTDLKVNYLGIGEFNERTKAFSPKTTIDLDGRSAVKFEVKNIGTKISTDWTYRVTLPGERSAAYVSTAQPPLLPQERAVVVVAFSDLSVDTGVEHIKVQASGGSDTLSSNNSFDWAVKIVD